MSRIKLSVIMPLYNQEKLFRIGLDSIPARDDIEIIVIDDCSTDDSLNVVREYQMLSKKNMVVLHNDENHGVAYTVNRGLDVATGEYVVLLGSDGDYFVNLQNAFEYLDGTDLVYFVLELNDGTFFTPNAGSCKFMRRAFVGDTRNPPLVNSEDNVFQKELVEKGPTMRQLDRFVMFKHYNFPREGSLVWRVAQGIDPPGKAI